MKLLICLLFFSNLVMAQSLGFAKDSAFVKLIDDLPAKHPFDTSKSYWYKIKYEYLYIISDKDLYEVFGYNIATRYRNFGFETYHILGKEICKQCELYCHHDEGQRDCHRNVCNKEWTWIMRDNKRAFTEIPSKGNLPLTSEQTELIKYKYSDTVLISNSDAGTATWITQSGGDCHATFKFGVFRDNYYQAIILKEWNYYGGCRAGGFWEFAINFPMPNGNFQTSKNVIFMKRNE